MLSGSPPQRARSAAFSLLESCDTALTVYRSNSPTSRRYQLQQSPHAAASYWPMERSDPLRTAAECLARVTLRSRPLRVRQREGGAAHGPPAAAVANEDVVTSPHGGPTTGIALLSSGSSSRDGPPRDEQRPLREGTDVSSSQQGEQQQRVVEEGPVRPTETKAIGEATTTTTTDTVLPAAGTPSSEEEVPSVPTAPSTTTEERNTIRCVSCIGAALLEGQLGPVVLDVTIGTTAALVVGPSPSLPLLSSSATHNNSAGLGTNNKMMSFAQLVEKLLSTSPSTARRTLQHLMGGSGPSTTAAMSSSIAVQLLVGGRSVYHVDPRNLPPLGFVLALLRAPNVLKIIPNFHDLMCFLYAAFGTEVVGVPQNVVSVNATLTALEGGGGEGGEEITADASSSHVASLPRDQMARLRGAGGGARTLSHADLLQLAGLQPAASHPPPPLAVPTVRLVWSLYCDLIQPQQTFYSAGPSSEVCSSDNPTRRSLLLTPLELDSFSDTLAAMLTVNGVFLDVSKLRREQRLVENEVRQLLQYLAQELRPFSLNPFQAEARTSSKANGDHADNDATVGVLWPPAELRRLPDALGLLHVLASDEATDRAASPHIAAAEEEPSPAAAILRTIRPILRERLNSRPSVIASADEELRSLQAVGLELVRPYQRVLQLLEHRARLVALLSTQSTMDCRSHLSSSSAASSTVINGLALHPKWTVRSTGRLFSSKPNVQTFSNKSLLPPYASMRSFLCAPLLPAKKQQHGGAPLEGSSSESMPSVPPNSFDELHPRQATEPQGIGIPSDDNLFVLLSLDYSQIELRLLAHLANDPVLLRCFQQEQASSSSSSVDVFARLGETLLRGELQSSFEPLVGVAGATSEGSEPASMASLLSEQKQRTVAKVVTYSVLYGIGERHLAELLVKEGIVERGEGDNDAQQTAAVHRARRLTGTFFRQFPAVAAFLEKVRTTALTDQGRMDGVFRTVWRPFRSSSSAVGWFERDAQIDRYGRQVVSQVVQGSASDLLRHAWHSILNLPQQSPGKKGGLAFAPVLSIHDEVVVVVHQQQVSEVARALQRAMVDVGVQAGLKVPLLVKATVGTHLGAMVPLPLQ